MTLLPVELACFHYSGFGALEERSPHGFAKAVGIALYILSVALVRSSRWTGVTRYGDP